MLHILFSLVSWGSLLLLNMPERKIGAAQTAVLFLCGMGWILRKKPGFGEKMPPKWLILVAAAILVAMGQCFYGHWMGSYKILPIARLLHVSVGFLVSAVAVALTLCAGGAVFYITQKLYTILSDPDDTVSIKQGIWGCLIMACVSVAVSQIMIGTNIMLMGPLKLLGNMMIPAVAALFLYCLLGKPFPAAAAGTGVFMLLSTVNAYVYQFRSRLFEPVDIFSIGTAWNVADHYSLWPIPSGVVAGWILWLAALLGLLCVIPKRKGKLPGKRRWMLALCCAVMVAGMCGYAATLETYHWEKQGAQFNGYFLDFAAKVKEAFILPPEGYNPEAVAQLEDRYGAGDSSEAKGKPHVIVIMDEAFSDLSVHGELTTNVDVMPFLSSLRENTIRGYALASVFGGNTANSEFEYLTGNSMAWLSENAVPYQQYIRRDAYSMVSYLKGQYGYHCVAMHPYLSNGWNRPAVYDSFGFDEQYFLEDFPQEDLIRDYVSDREMFEYLTDAFEAWEEEPLFLFGVTMQNHGGYDVPGFESTVTLTGQAYPDAEQYLSLLRETDRAVEYLIRYFESVEEEVVVVFFGDHQPKLDESFFRTLGNEEETLEDRQKRYQVPFFIWANYDIPEQEGILTSLNYLSNYAYEAAGLPLPAYNRFLAEMAEHIPAINSQGFYSNASGCYLTFEEASVEEQRWLADYRLLQYNSLWDTDNRSDRLFPLPPKS